MKTYLDYAVVAAVSLPLVGLAACAQVSSLASTVSADAPQVVSALDTICGSLVPAAEATANALAKGGAAATIQSAEDNYVTPACAAAKTAIAAVDSGWLANVVASLVTTAANSQPATAAQGGGN
jgi:benzoyl-CoA reductase/2-hydroxyglutaryl-CoA dehydratase subunit BcrC/BadD/HgdB